MYIYIYTYVGSSKILKDPTYIYKYICVYIQIHEVEVSDKFKAKVEVQ